MLTRLARALALTCLTLPAAALADPLPQAEAEALVAPFYAALSQAGTADIPALMARIATPDYQSFATNDAAGQSAAEVAAGLKGLAQAVPDLAFRVVEVIPAEDRIIVRSEATGTPAVPMFGLPSAGKPFRIMAIDIWTMDGDKVSSIHHVEDWATGIRQMSGG